MPEDRVERLVELSGRGRLDAQPALLVDDVPLGVELAEDGVLQPVGLHPEPELELVLRDGDEVGRQVVRREGVHPGGAVLRVDPVELVLDEEVALLLDEHVELRLELLVAGRLVLRLRDVVDLAAAPGRAHLRLLGPHLVAQLLLLGDDLEVPLRVLRAERRRPLEHHVLEEVADAGDADALVDAADLRDPAGGDRRLVGALDEEELHPVREDVLLGLDFLGRGGASEEEGRGGGGDEGLSTDGHGHLTLAA